MMLREQQLMLRMVTQVAVVLVVPQLLMPAARQLMTAAQQLMTALQMMTTVMLKKMPEAAQQMMMPVKQVFGKEPSLSLYNQPA
jgi:hypothetical protein